MAVQAHTFPEIEGPDFVRSSDVEAVAEKVLELHGGVGGVGRIREIAEAIAEGELRIMWLLNEKPFNEDAEDDQEPEIAGRCVKAPRIWHDVTGVDFAIWARKYFWGQYGPSALAGEGGRYVRAAALFAGEPEPILTKGHDVVESVESVTVSYGGESVTLDAAARERIDRKLAETKPAAVAVCAEKFGPQRRLICTREPGHKGHHVDSEVRP